VQMNACMLLVSTSILHNVVTKMCSQIKLSSNHFNEKFMPKAKTMAKDYVLGQYQVLFALRPSPSVPSPRPTSRTLSSVTKVPWPPGLMNQARQPGYLQFWRLLQWNIYRLHVPFQLYSIT